MVLLLLALRRAVNDVDDGRSWLVVLDVVGVFVFAAAAAQLGRQLARRA